MEGFKSHYVFGVAFSCNGKNYQKRLLQKEQVLWNSKANHEYGQFMYLNYLLRGSILYGAEEMVDMKEEDLGCWNKLKKSRCASCSKLMKVAVFILCTFKLAKYQQGTRLKECN